MYTFRLGHGSHGMAMTCCAHLRQFTARMQRIARTKRMTPLGRCGTQPTSRGLTMKMIQSCPVKWMILSDYHVYDFTLPVDSHTCRHVSLNSIHIVAYNFWWANGLQLPWALEQQGETVKLEFVISSNLQCASFISVAVALLGSCSTKLNGPVDHLKLRHWGHYQVQLQW